MTLHYVGQVISTFKDKVEIKLDLKKFTNLSKQCGLEPSRVASQIEYTNMKNKKNLN